jgi:hypothetical protein
MTELLEKTRKNGGPISLAMIIIMMLVQHVVLGARFEALTKPQLQEVMTMQKTALDAHASHPHTGSVSRTELSSLEEEIKLLRASNQDIGKKLAELTGAMNAANSR